MLLLVENWKLEIFDGTKVALWALGWQIYVR
jgi:hypothetical protein